MSTPFHAKYFAHELSRLHRGSSVEKLSASLFDASVDLNPHQIDAALFALRSPLSKGVILADEVGLGKTIEAGLVACQYWAERKRKILVICPASLRKQWSAELIEKFHLPNEVLDSRTFKLAQKEGRPSPFESSSIIICSIHFAARNSTRLRTIPWDLVIIDEAHKLRNVYQRYNKMGQELKWALEDRKKILLTATPLQNSLPELFGLASLIDDHYFGDIDVFRQKFGRNGNLEELRERLAPLVKRTLRSQVVEYIRYTRRQPLTLFYEPGDPEHALYEAVSDFIRQENSYAIPTSQRHLLTLILRKLLASSTHAIAGTLSAMKNRLLSLRDGLADDASFVEELVYQDEIEEDLIEELELASYEDDQEIDPQKLEEEIAKIDSLLRSAERIRSDAKSHTLLEALETGFAKMAEMGANRKVVIFTESRRTQEYLKSFLSANGFGGETVLFNGSNSDADAQLIYRDWLEKNRDSGRISGSKQIDVRTALIEHFRDHASILIATEAAAEGINLQFCSLVINYDLPWNPQRIEQRIGRCHRYGQMHDVVVINFINKRNDADQRVFELLNEKFSLFSGVFGASDQVLGNIESGVDFEKRILEIYDRCRSPEEISAAFEQLKQEMDDSIQHRLDDTRRILLEHFDQDVHDRLKVTLDESKQHLDRTNRMFWELSHLVLGDYSRFDDASYRFNLVQSPIEEAKPGFYHLVTKADRHGSSDFLYRLAHPLGEFVLHKGREIPNQMGHIYFDLSNHDRKISLLNKFRRKSGWMALHLLEIEGFEREEYLLFAGVADDGIELDQEVCEKFFLLRGASSNVKSVPEDIEHSLLERIKKSAGVRIEEARQKNHDYFIEECDKLDTWAEEMIAAGEAELNSLKRDIREFTRLSRRTEDVVEQHRLQVKVRELEGRKKKARERLYQLEDEIIAKRDELIARLEGRKKDEHSLTRLFIIRWTVI